MSTIPVRDLTGQRFGKLVAIEDTGKRKRGLAVWRCKCDCGNECEAVGSTLVKGTVSSCGCKRSFAARDITGERFGKLVAVAPTSKRHRGSVIWTCRCDCGRECEVPLRPLMTGDRRTCGQCRPRMNARDITGERFGKLVAVAPTAKRERGSVVWTCKCDCGRECEVALWALTLGRVKDCGCASAGKGNSGARDLVGQRFGKLVVVEATRKREYGSVVWRCQCDCGNVCEATTSKLTSGRKKSCGCLRRKGNPGEGGLPAGAKDLSGKKFGDLTAVRVVGRQGTHAVWECVCNCGNVCTATSGNLGSGRTASCGCRLKGRDPLNIAGDRFGKLVAVEVTGDEDDGSPVWRCLCDCDRVVRVCARDLALGRVDGCGEC